MLKWVAWKSGSLELSVMYRQRERWYWQHDMGMNQTGGWLVGSFLLLPHQKQTQTTYKAKKQQTNKQTHTTETICRGRMHTSLLSMWHLVGLSWVPSLLLRKKRSCGAGFLQRYPGYFQMLLSCSFFLLSACISVFPWMCWKEQVSLWKCCLWRKILPSSVLSFINTTETRQKEGVFLLKKYILFSLRQIPYSPLPNENL